MPSADAIAADWASASNSQRALIQSMGQNPTITGFSASPSQAILDANPGFPFAGSNPSNPFPPINVNYISTPGDGSGLTSTDSNGGSGLNYLLIIGIVVVAAIVLFMVK